MKWFKHDSDANRDSKLEKVLMRYGAEGYALYWLCLELIAGQISASKLSFELEHDSEILAYRLKLDSAKVEEMMRYMVDLDLFEIEETTQRITCLKIAERIENSVVRNSELAAIQKRLKAGTIHEFPETSGKTPKVSYSASDASGTSGLEEKRLEKTRNRKEEAHHHEMAREMFSLIRNCLPKAKEPNWEHWARDIRLMEERDNRTSDEIRSVFLWANQDDFWSANVLSPSNLRKNFDRLQSKMHKALPNERDPGVGAI